MRPEHSIVPYYYDGLWQIRLDFFHRFVFEQLCSIDPLTAKVMHYWLKPEVKERWYGDARKRD